MIGLKLYKTNMKKLGVQKHRIEDLYSYFHNSVRVVDMDYVKEMQQEVDQRPEMENSLYFQHIKDALMTFGDVFGSIRDEKDVVERFEKVREMVDSIKKEYKPVWDYEMQLGLPYGAVTGILRDGKVYIVDGHHRLAILYALGHKDAEVLVFDENDFWYQDRYPVDSKLDSIDYDWKGKKVLDLGCNIGMVSDYVLQRGAVDYRGVDLNEEYIQEAKSRHPDIADKFSIKGAEEMSKGFTPDVVVALGLFHHLSNRTVESIIKAWQGDLIFECPTGEKEYSEYRVRTKEWYMDLVKDWDVVVHKSGMPLDPSYPFERLTFVCKK